MYGSEKLFNKYANKDKIWIFGMDPEKWPHFLSKYGWNIIEDVDFRELDEKYIKPAGRTLTTTPVERLIYAEKL